ncbi:66_t:CDS:1 [Paraglomus brasilianum]|uniref:Nickel/cobalt efflux system n=1 Tax=Paraglomus brasilianum TaxID=144538 RepID=A0A9N9GSF6_9GLOM|nr:66_t:CDS:1 [Paraglomus brasilianum]
MDENVEYNADEKVEGEELERTASMRPEIVQSSSRTPLLHRYDSRALKRKIILIFIGFVLVNIATWAGTVISFRNYPKLIGTASLAYMLGLRHAVDADHLAAIDNVTRKLLQTGQRSVCVGFFFSLGHSTIVIAASLAIAVTAMTIKDKFGDLETIGSIIGASISATFLLAIGIMNTFVLVSVYRSLQRLKRTGTFEEEDINDILNNSGCLGRFFAPVFRFIDKSWKMYPLGVLFGFGFDTSTEVGLLGIAAIQANQGLAIWLIMYFPLLFTVGMATIDTLDGILMLGTYSWAYINPVRKLYYNLTITFLSILIAFIIGGIELLNIIANQLEAQGPFWAFLAALGDHFGTMGFIIIGLFVITWIISVIFYRFSSYRELEERLVHQSEETAHASNASDDGAKSTRNSHKDSVVVGVDEVNQEEILSSNSNA